MILQRNLKPTSLHGRDARRNLSSTRRSIGFYSMDKYLAQQRDYTHYNGHDVNTFRRLCIRIGRRCES